MVLSEVQTLTDEQGVLYAAVATVTWLAWDVLIHLDLEVEYIWQRPRVWVKCIYFLIRYVPVLHLGAMMTLTRGIEFSSRSCRIWIYYELIFGEFLTFAVEVVLVMRSTAVSVLYNRNRLVLGIIIGALCAEVTAMSVILVIVLPKLTFRSTCLIAQSPGTFMGFWMSTLCFETFLFLLTLYKFKQSVARDLGKHSVIYIFMRDGTWAFALIFAALLFNMLMYKLANSPLAGLGYGYILSAMSFAGSHVLLNLRSIGNHLDSYTSRTSRTSNLISASNIRFAADPRGHSSHDDSNEDHCDIIELNELTRKSSAA